MLKKAIAVVSLGALFLQPLPAFADHWDHGHGRFDRDYHRERFVHRLAPGYIALTVRGMELLYNAGMFYRYTPRGYVIVSAPPGAIVPALPPGYTVFYSNGAPYYYYGDTYYVASPTGYVVAQPPVAIAPAPAIAAPAAVAAPAAPAQAQAAAPQQPSANNANNGSNDFEIHIPNSNGSFTLVTIRQTDKGFVGPQGEFYADYPTVEQLRAKYSK